ncbi:MAG: hypothetical protein ACLVJ6_12150 [Merdibacter sp.]
MGVSKGVLFVMGSAGTYGEGVAWNGLSTITESPEGAEPSDIWADNIKYATLRSTETFSGTIEAYTYPDEFNACNGEATLVEGATMGQQSRATFGLCYRTEIGSDTASDGTAGYKLHFLYGLTASPSEKAYASINDSPEAIAFSWEVSSTPVTVTSISGAKPTSTVVVDSRTADSTKLRELEKMVYGDTATTSKLPTPDEIYTLLNEGT